MTTHSFSLRLEGVPLDHDRFVAFSNAVFGPDVDCTPGVVAGAPEVAFDMPGDSLRDAVRKAIEHLHRMVPSAVVVGVMRDDGRPIDAAFAASA